MAEEEKSIEASTSEEEDDDDSGIEVDYSGGISSKSIYTRFFLFCISILFSISSYSGLIDLQSSINISDALGNKSLMLMSVTTVICCLFLTPVAIDVFGAKNTILLSQLCYVVYVASNFYPTPYVLLPGGVFLGIAEGLLYAPVLMYCTYFGRTLAGINSNNAKHDINRLVGYFWAIFQMNEIIGNSISTVILHLGRKMSEESNESSTHIIPQINSSTFISNDSRTMVLPESITINEKAFSANVTLNDLTLSTVFSSMMDVENITKHANPGGKYSMCGANDCYDENEYETREANYIPLSRTAVYIMITVYASLAVIAIPIMLRTPSLPRKYKSSPTKCKDTEKASKVWTYFEMMGRHLRRTALQLTDSLQLLLTPLTLYHGLYVSFISSEVTRAFVSCTVGVEQVGLGMLTGGIVNVIVSFVYGHVSENKIGRAIFLCTAISLDVFLYLFCLFWRPTEDNAYLAIVVCIIFGFTDGVWSPFLDGKYAKYFSNNEKIAYSVNNLWNCVGFTMTYGWTTLLCVRQKIYIQIFSLVFGVLCLIGAECLYKRRRLLQTV